MVQTHTLFLEKGEKRVWEQIVPFSLRRKQTRLSQHDIYSACMQGGKLHKSEKFMILKKKCPFGPVIGNTRNSCSYCKVKRIKMMEKASFLGQFDSF
jgi:hypothetical protein